MLAAVLLLVPTHGALYAMVAAVSLLLVGLLDDRFCLTVSIRLMTQIAAAACLVAGGFVVHSVGALGQLDTLAVPFTVLCIVAFINACNMVDGADGLLAGSLAPGCIAVALQSSGALQVGSLLMTGALIGFLLTNWPAAPGSVRSRWRTFLGNGGVKFVAVIVAAMLIAVTQKYQALRPGAVPFLVLIPLAELANTCARRLLGGASATSGDMRHFHHRLLAAGYSRRRVAFGYVVASAVAVSFGLFGSEVLEHDAMLWAAAAAVLSAATVFGVQLPQRRGAEERAAPDLAAEPVIDS
jgi:UDP-GlcNAc:undecaprenyl-phosphate GlcNAc-1-phosphate transferase